MTVVSLPSRKPRPKPFERGDHVELAERLIDQLSATGQLVHDDGETYQYSHERHVFEAVPQAQLSKVIQGFAGAPVAAGEKVRPLRLRATDVGGAIQMAQHQLSQPGFFDAAPRGIVFRDAFVRVTAQQISLHEHSPDHRARYAYPFDFVPDAQPRRWLEFWGEVFQGDPDAEQKVRCVQEYVGSALLGLCTQYQRALVNEGLGANGKSVGCTVIEHAMPPGSCVSIPPQDWGNEYRLAMLAGKLLNVVAELPEAEILKNDAVKSVISGDSRTGRHIRQPPFTFQPQAGHVFSANKLPGTADQSHGFWRRFIVIRYNRIFSEAEQDAQLARRIIDSELPEVVSWFVQGGQRAMQLGGYTVPTSSDDAIAEWRYSADQVRAFIGDWTEPLGLDEHPSLGVKAANLYQAYRRWAERNGHRMFAANTFGERMRLAGSGAIHTKFGSYYPLRLRENQ